MSLKDYNINKNNLGYFNKRVLENDSFGVFVFMSCKKINPEEQIEKRLDEGQLGPVCINWDPTRPFALPYPLNSFKNIKYMKKIISCEPNFYIIYLEAQESVILRAKRNYDSLPDWQKEAIDNGWIPEEKFVDATDIEDKLISIHPQRHARTLGELFRLIIEWAYVFDAPFNNTEPAAELCKLILEELNMTDDVKNELLTEFPDSHVAMYLKNDPNALNRPSGVPNITPLFDEWIEQIMLDYYDI